MLPCGWYAHRILHQATLLTLEVAEFTVFLNRPGLVVPRDLKAALPCADEIWEAKTEQEWEYALLSQPDFGSSKPSACDILDYRNQNPSLLSKAHSSAFASSVLYVFHVDTRDIAYLDLDGSGSNCCTSRCKHKPARHACGLS